MFNGVREGVVEELPLWISRSGEMLAIRGDVIVMNLRCRLIMVKVVQAILKFPRGFINFGGEY